MKKILAILASMLMACSVMTACGDKEDKKDEKKNDTSVSDKADKNEQADADAESDDAAKNDEAAALDIEVALSDDPAAPLGETVGDEIEVDKNAFASLENLKDAKEYTFDVEMSVASEMITMDMPIAITTDGTNTHCTLSMMGINVEMLILDGKTYVLDQTNKVYYVDESGEQAASLEGFDKNELASMVETVKSANKVTIDGVELDRYTVETEGVESFAYVYSGELQYIASVTESGEKTLVTFNELSEKANADLLKLPEGFEEITVDEYTELVYGDMFSDESDESDEAVEE